MDSSNGVYAVVDAGRARPSGGVARKFFSSITKDGRSGEVPPVVASSGCGFVEWWCGNCLWDGLDQTAAIAFGTGPNTGGSTGFEVLPW